MSYTRNIEPQILSIEAIIRKSELKNKVLNSIPVDLKKLFMEQVSKVSKRKIQAKKQFISTEHINSNTYQKDESNFSKDITYFAPNKNPRSLSMNSTQYNKNLETIQSLQTTRTANLQGSNKNVNKKRYSVGQIGKIQKIKQYMLTQNENKNMENIDTKGNATAYPKGSKSKYRRVQFELIMPAKQTKYQGLRKVQSQSGRPIQKDRLQKQLENQKMAIKTEEQDNIERLQKNFTNNTVDVNERQTKTTNSKRRKKLGTEEEVIPDFIMAAVETQSKKISPIKPYKMEACKIFEQIDDESKNEQHRSKSTKLPSCVVQMKKKANFYKARKSQQSYQDILEPKVQFLRLIEKSKGEMSRKHSEVIKKEKVKLRQKIPTFHGTKRKVGKIQFQQQLNGWEIKDNPQLYDYC